MRGVKPVGFCGREIVAEMWIEMDLFFDYDEKMSTAEIQEDTTMNHELFQAINQWAGHFSWLDQTMILIANLSPAMFAGILLLLWFGGTEEARASRQRTAILAALSTGLALLANQGIHAVYWHPRPFVDHAVHQLIPHSATESSFVSDHTALAFAVAITIMMRGHRGSVWVFLLAVLTALSRVFVGVHYPADVLGGACLAFVTSALLVSFPHLAEPVVQWVFRMYGMLAGRVPILSRYRTDRTEYDGRSRQSRHYRL